MSSRKLTRKEKIQQPTESAKKKQVESVSNNKNYFIWIVGIISFLLFANSLNFGYALDDYSLILENKSTLKGFTAIKEIFATSYRYGYIFVSDDLYRPLSKAIFAIQWGLSPNKPFLGHLTNVSLFALTCMVMYRLLNKITSNNFLAIGITLFYAVLPIHTEVVSNIKSLDEILAMFFGLLALEGFYNYSLKENSLSLFRGAFCFWMALISKESSVTFLAVIPLFLYYFTAKDAKWILKPSLISLGIVILFLGIRAKVLGSANVSLSPAFVDNMLVSAPSVLIRYATAITILGTYLLKMIVPFNLSFDNSFPQIPFSTLTDMIFIVSFLILTFMLVFSIFSLKKKDIIGFGFLFFFITASVSSNIFVTIGTHWGERLMYVPSFGIIFSISVIIYRFLVVQFSINPKVVAGITCCIFILYGTISISRNTIWKDNYSLYSSGLISAPKSTRVHYYMGNYLIKEDVLKGKSAFQQDSILKLGIDHLQTALKLTPTFTDAWNQLGLAYFRMKDNEKAISSYLNGIKTNPNDPTVYNNLGTVYFTIGKYTEALAEFNTAVRLNPNYSDAWMNVGSSNGTLQQFDIAIAAFERAVAIDPNNAQAYYFLGITWKAKGNAMLAQQFLDKAEMLRNKAN